MAAARAVAHFSQCGENAEDDALQPRRALVVEDESASSEVRGGARSERPRDEGAAFEAAVVLDVRPVLAAGGAREALRFGCLQEIDGQCLGTLGAEHVVRPLHPLDGVAGTACIAGARGDGDGPEASAVEVAFDLE